MISEYENMSLYELLNIHSSKLKPGANDNLISDFESQYNISLPKEYKDLLKYSNGATLFGEDILLFSLEEIINNNTFSNGSLLVIGKYNFGDFVCIDIKTENIVQVSQENNSIFFEHYNLKDWIISSIEEMEFA